MVREPVTIKLYDNRRLFWPAIGRYVTFDELLSLSDDGTKIEVRDARTGVDVTRLLFPPSSTEH